VANLDDAYARLAWREGRSIRAVDLSEEGRRVLLIAKTDYLQQLFLVDVERGSKFDLSGQKGDVEDAQLHPAGDLVVFSSAVGGVCAVWWVDMTLRRRKDMLSSVEGCYGAVRLESSRRLVLYENVVGLTGSTTVLYDRKTRQPRPSLPAGCRAIELSGDGRYTVARCSADPRGSGLYLFATPEEE